MPEFAKSAKIVLTDYPKLKHIKANVRGMGSDELFENYKDAFHLMMCFVSIGCFGGYSMDLDFEDIEAEFEFRNDDRIKRFRKGEKL